MWRYDFLLFYQAGQAVLAGQSPYQIFDFNPPYPLAVLFAPLALMPEPLAYALYLMLCLWLLWKAVGTKLIWPLLSFPVFFNLFVGQTDLALGLLASLVGPWAFPFLIVKPQVAFVLAPWIIVHSTWKQLVPPVLVTIGFVGFCFLLRPTWVQEWLGIIPTLDQYARRDANLYWLAPAQIKTVVVVVGSLVGLALAFWLKERQHSWTAAHLLAPLTNIYSASVLAEWIGPLEVVLSWIAILIAGNIHSGAPLFVVGLSILIRPLYKKIPAFVRKQ
jgi:hypothetical protein